MRQLLVPPDLKELVRAKALLEGMTFTGRLIDSLGKPVEWAAGRLPDGARRKIALASEKALLTSVDLACRTLWDRGGRADRLHRLAVTCTGAAGGFFGLAGLSVELPLSTSLMLRSIAQIARAEGENLADPDSRLACVQVFALGSSGGDENANSTYLFSRSLLAREMRSAAAWIAAGPAVPRQGAPVLVDLARKLALRFGLTVQEKVLAAALPVLGALGGAAINAVFIDFYQDKAAGHFIYRRLERKYGAAPVEEAYRALPT